MKKLTYYFFAVVLCLMHHAIFSQDLYDILGNDVMGGVDNSVLNINASQGTQFQDLKRATGILLTLTPEDYLNNACSGTLINTVKQSKIPYILTAAHCIRGNGLIKSTFPAPKLNDSLKVFLSFDYEMSDAEEQGDDHNLEHKKITSGKIINTKIVVLDKRSDIMLLEIQNGAGVSDVLQYAYAAGWDNSLTAPSRDVINISHPDNDHKKLFVNPRENIALYYNVDKKTSPTPAGGNPLPDEGYINEAYTPWGGIDERPIKGSSGSGFFSDEGRLTHVLSDEEERKEEEDEDEEEEEENYYYVTRFTHIANQWYADPPQSDDTNMLSHYLDPDNTWGNSVPGGYYNERVALEDGNFTLELKAGEVVMTPGITATNDALEEDVMYLNNAVAFRQNFFELIEDEEEDEEEDDEDEEEDEDEDEEEEHNLPTWELLKGLCLEAANSSRIVLSVYYLDENEQTGQYVRRLLYGSYADNTVNADNLFREEGWDCANVPPGFPDCNRPEFTDDDEDETLTMGVSNDPSQYYSAILKSLNEGNDIDDLVTLSEIIIPIQVVLENKGNEDVTVKALSYPGNVPLNAFQLFKRQAFEQQYITYRYRESRGNNSDNLHITNLKVTQLENEKQIRTGNNGGYLNLVNPNFKIFDGGGVEMTYTDEEGNRRENTLQFEIEFQNGDEGTPAYQYSYAVYLDYFNSEALNGKNDTNYTYNFVDDPTPHNIERIYTSPTPIHISGRHTATFSYPLPHHDDIELPRGETRKTRLRVAVKRGDTPPNQDELFETGEVEDYLIELRAPSEEQEPLKQDAEIDLKNLAKRPRLKKDPTGDTSRPTGSAGDNLLYEPTSQQNNQGNALALSVGLRDLGSAPTTFNLVLISIGDILTLAYQSLAGSGGLSPDDPGQTCPNDPNPNNDPYPGYDPNDAAAWQYWAQFNSLYNNLARIIRWWDNLNVDPSQQVPFIIDAASDVDWAIFEQFINAYHNIEAFKSLVDGTGTVYDLLYLVGQEGILEAAVGAGNVANYRNLYNYILKFQCFKDQLNTFLDASGRALNFTQNLAKIAVDWWGEVIPNNHTERTIVHDRILTDYPEAGTTSVIYHAKGDNNHTIVGVNSAGQLIYELKVGAETKTITSTDPVPLDERVLITHSFDNGEMKLYINDTEVGTENISATSFGYTNYTDLNNGARLGAPLKNFTDPGANDGLVASNETFYETLVFEEVLAVIEIGDLVPNPGLAARTSLKASNDDQDLKEVKEDLDFSIFPNPAKDELNILIEVPQAGALSVDIFNLNKVNVYTMQRPYINKGHQLITLSNLGLSAGYYIVKTVVGNTVKTEQVIFE